MSAIQVLLLALFALIVFVQIKKYFVKRSLEHYSAAEAAEKIKRSRNILLLDVRTSQERKVTMIKGSFHIPVHEIASRMDELNKFKDKEIICYCRTGNRSVTAASKLKKHGFNSANLLGGINAWNAKGSK
ncbi:MAG: rhodanese-like domain-containing protein [Ignavibacteriaceae bacterium]